MTIADAHLHLFASGFAGNVDASLFPNEAAAYERFRRLHDIEAGLVVGYEGEGIDPDNNAFIRAEARKRPWMTTVAHVPCGRSPGRGPIEAYLDAGHAGISLYPADAGDAAEVATWPASVWRPLVEKGAIVSLNAEPAAIAALRPAIAANPACVFLVSHLGMPGTLGEVPSTALARRRLAPLLEAAALPNVMVKLSGLYAVSDPPHAYPHEAATPFVDAIVERFGAGRCVWGSDFSPALDHVSFAQTLAIPAVAALGPDERDAVMGRNLMSILRRVHGR